MNIDCSKYRNADIQILIHHIYEYNKGIRNMILHTMSSEQRDLAEFILNQKNIDYIVQEVNSNKINIFFGSKYCVDIIRSFENIVLSDYTPEQDFILGIMLGYDRKEQCKRYIKMHAKRESQVLVAD